MDSDKDIRVILKNILGKFFSSTEIPEELRKVYIGNSEMKDICNKIFPDIETIKQEVINQDVLIDLEIFEGLGLDRENSIYSNINKCKTHLGSFLLKNMLGNPTKDIDTLISRQTIVKKLVENQELYDKLENKLDIIKENELDILYLWKTLDEETRYLINMVYFQNRFLKMFNKNELVLKIYNFYIIIFSPLHGILTPIFMVLAPFIFLRYYFKKEITLSLYFKLLKVSISGISNIMKFNPSEDNSSWSVTQMISLLMWLIFYVHALFSNIQMAKSTNEIINILHLKLNGMSSLVKEGHNLFDIIGNDIVGYSKIIPFEVEKKFGILWDDIFTQQPHIMSNKGRILH